MKIVGAAIWVLAALMTIQWAVMIRGYVRAARGITQQTVNTGMLFALSTLAVPVLSLSPLHLLWLLPASWLLGTLSLAFPFSLLSLPGHFFGQLCCVGLSTHPQESVSLAWQTIFDNADTSDKKTLEEQITTFFQPDHINPLAFLANFGALSRLSLDPVPDVDFPPTPSVATFEGGLNAPLGYPRWFIAAYPDVVLWLAQMDEDAGHRMVLSVFGAERFNELTKTFGAQKASEIVEEELNDDEGRFKPLYLRRLVDAYQKHTGRHLECAV